MTELTQQQERVLAYVVAYKAQHGGNSPTIREIGAGLSIDSTNAVRDHLNALVRKGKLTREPGRVRSIVVIAA